MKRTKDHAKYELGHPTFFRRSGLAVLLLGLALLPGVTGCSDAYREVLNRPLGREVIRDPSAWWGTSEGKATVYAQNSEWLQEALDKVSFARARAARLIGVPAEVEQAVCCYLVQEEALWQELSKKYAIHSNTVSLTVGNEVVCLVRTREELIGDAVPHELMHVLMHQSGLRLPLAIEEGMALYFGWEINLEYHLSLGDIVQKKKSRPSRGPWMGLDALLQVTAYPREAEALMIFYAQSERLVQAANELIGTPAMVNFLRHADNAGRGFREVLTEDYGCGAEQMAWVERVVSAPVEIMDKTYE